MLLYRVVGDTNITETDVSKYSNEKVIYNLSKFVYYQFMVKVYNKIGSGPSSTPVTVFVGEAGKLYIAVLFQIIYVQIGGVVEWLTRRTNILS